MPSTPVDYTLKIELTENRKSVTCVCIVDKATLVTVSADGTVMLWK